MIFKYLNGNQKNFENRLRLILRSRKFIQNDISKSVKNIINKAYNIETLEQSFNNIDIVIAT